MSLSRRQLSVLLLSAAGALAHAADPATDFPNRAIRIVVPFSPGASNDTVARLVAPHLSEMLGQPVTVENRPGASGDIGTAMVARSKPDGYTILMTSNAATVSAATKSKPTFDVVKDLQPLVLVGTQPMLLVAGPVVEANTLQAYFDSAKASPEKYSFATPGAATPHHLTFELINSAKGLRMIHVPFPGTAQSLNEVMAGRVSATLATKVSAGPLVQDGRVKVLAVVARQRLPEYPQVPTLIESGMSNLESGFWYGFTLPSGTPQPIADKLSQTMLKALALPQVREQVRKMDIDPGSSLQGAAFGKFIADDFQKWKTVAEQAKIRVD